MDYMWFPVQSFIELIATITFGKNVVLHKILKVKPKQ